MVWCGFCSKECATGTDHCTGIVSCIECGRVQFQDMFTDEPTFVKGAGGESRLAGSYVRSIQSENSESYRRTLEKGSTEIHYLIVQLTSEGNDNLERQASCFYKIAVERGFTRGRRTPHVAASCLYIACRTNKQPYLLIDFAMLLTVNVYVLGAVFLQLCKLLSLEEHPIVQQLVDPSLFMHRFTSLLMKGDFLEEVLHTALNIVASMKRDWMQTGRKPSGICGAALYISALSHGFIYSKSDILRVVHICEATLTKRLIEFEGTTSGGLTIEELNEKAQEYKKEKRSKILSRVVPAGNEKAEVLCQHKGKEPCFAHGLCRDCYEDFLDISGGLDGEAEPPAFQRAEMVRLANTSFCQDTGNTECVDAGSTAAEKSEMHYSGTFEKYTDDPNNIDEDNLSDIDDVEVNLYLHSEEESHFKKIIWEEMNKEYLEEQAAKQAAAAAAAAASKDFGDDSEESRKARELAAATATALAETREKKRQKRAMDAKNAVPPQTAVEATRQMLQKKGYSSKINYAELEKLFEESDDISVKTDDTWKEKQKDSIEQEENEKENEDENEEENEEETIENVENYVDDQWYDGEENMYNYDDYDPENYEGEW
ncbi:hypothetical protein Leryth_023960 [Lithospermum erythrorhizon]|nr:hypothetical protein Leryth_023960 [Lithospermum erythrorhizon]